MEVSTMCYFVGVVVIFVSYALRLLNLVWFKPKKTEKLLREQGLQGNSYKFFFGDLKEMVHLIVQAKSKPIGLTDDIVSRIIPFVHKSVSTHGKVCFTWMGHKPVLQVSEPCMIREIYANYHQFQKPRGGNPLSKLLVKGLIDTDADQWIKHRKIINPAFHVDKLKHMVPAFYVSCIEMINKWEEMLTKQSACEVDVWPYLQSFTSDVISRTAFGSSFEEGRKIFQLQREQAELIIKAEQSIYIPGSRFLPTQSNMRIKEIDREVRASIRSIINKRVIMLKVGGIKNDDLLGILLDSNYKEIKQQGNLNFGLTIEEVIEECKLFYFAGQETTGNMLVWTMILLSQYTNWQARARNEVLDIFGEKKPDIDGLSRLRVVSMIFNEVLRLYPPGAALGRMIHEETKVGNITLPAGTHIQLNALLVHHDRDLWGDDAKEFNPERFSKGVSKATNGQASYIPFGAGPRICIGQNFAMMEAKLALTPSKDNLTKNVNRYKHFNFGKGCKKHVLPFENVNRYKHYNFGDDKCTKRKVFKIGLANKRPAVLPVWKFNGFGGSMLDRSQDRL
ncbi:cytochrome P450 [Artemisia annua]|uniref:Cytochrome P450 n=1 Tax=Artemisia annua TaxID=35608 RepID=A0A2U1L6F2_ARTAN|nr:cytochrome P450 [Artemisia annua]